MKSFLIVISSLFFIQAAYATDCPISGTLTDGNQYSCSGDIYTQGTTEVDASTSVTITATGDVTLNPGFHAEAGSTCIILSGDSDQDGLSDVWEMAFFGSLSYGKNDDPDGDDITNYWEFLHGDYGVVDSDNDGLPDWWEIVKYGDLSHNEQSGSCDCDD